MADSGWLSSCASVEAISPSAVRRDMCISSACISCRRAWVSWRSVRSRTKPVKKRWSPRSHLADRELHREGRAVLALAHDDAADADDPPLAGAAIALEVAVVAVAVGLWHQHLDVPADGLFGRTVAELPLRRGAERLDDAAARR